MSKDFTQESIKDSLKGDFIQEWILGGRGLRECVEALAQKESHGGKEITELEEKAFYQYMDGKKISEREGVDVGFLRSEYQPAPDSALFRILARIEALTGKGTPGHTIERFRDPNKKKDGE